jgi:hypothetical protein
MENVQSSSTESPAIRANANLLGVPVEPSERAAPSDEVARRQTRLEIQNRTADAIDRIASSIDFTGHSTSDLMKDQLKVYKEQAETAVERGKQKTEMHKVEIRKKLLEGLTFLRDNKVISNEEFSERAKR